LRRLRSKLYRKENIVDDGEIPQEVKEEIAEKRGTVDNYSKTFQVCCPDCKCDYFIPMMRATYQVSFAGNRATMEWPSREHTGDSLVAGCPACGIMYRVDPAGQVLKLENRWKTLK
jgi:hypothetical protein